nr:hypothetical protein [Streptomyces sp. SID5468]
MPTPAAPPATPPPGTPTAPPPAPGTIVIREIYLPLPPAPPAPPRWRWSWEWLQPRRNLIGTVLALLPVFGGWSLASGWGHLLRECRAEQSTGAAWTLAGLALAVAIAADRWRPRWYTRALSCAAVLGTIDMAHLFDIVTLFTGVTR